MFWLRPFNIHSLSLSLSLRPRPNISFLLTSFYCFIPLWLQTFVVSVGLVKTSGFVNFIVSFVARRFREFDLSFVSKIFNLQIRNFIFCPCFLLSRLFSTPSNFQYLWFSLILDYHFNLSGFGFLGHQLLNISEILYFIRSFHLPDTFSSYKPFSITQLIRPRN